VPEKETIWLGVPVCELPTRFAIHCESCLRVNTEAVAGREENDTYVLLLPAYCHKVVPSDFLLIWSILNHLAVVPLSQSQVSHAPI
jgi:hypothetical protein